MSAAALRGLLRTAAYEHPELRASSVEFIEGRTPYADSVAELLDDEQPLTENRLLPEGRHVAHVVPGPDTDVPGISRPAEPLVRPGASYLVTGGMEGLGLLTVPWLARHGAGRIVTIGRSTPTPETERRLSELAATGTDILVLHGDIADPGLVRRALAMAGDAGRAVRGVLHAAGVIEDATLATLDEHLLERVWRRKAEGAWALHRATEDLALDFFALDFFVLYSSVPSLIGSPGQAAYATANAFLDGLAAHRRDHGLPATGIHWGAWRDVGRGQHLAERGFLTIVPTDGVDALERILTAGHHQVAYSPLDIAQWTAPRRYSRPNENFAVW
ncbi:SDR family oxidoreductase [Streptomyces sp. NPDC127033]|uniref:SDR family oxidoreductase n=1 Tax=Streptomyces sp. NPDC127033 TaxID=3347110 RepID=UPI0036690D89